MYSVSAQRSCLAIYLSPSAAAHTVSAVSVMISSRNCPIILFFFSSRILILLSLYSPVITELKSSRKKNARL
ncbi:hypothetical protein F5Y14DRAFT_403864 [Nemania sp. NC0429]|nr:hypothetical protein F5Y14DRAFT_403864 [Nemania sp. NC0429]